MIDLLDRRAVRVLTTALIFVGVLFFIYKVHETLILFLFALYGTSAADVRRDEGSRFHRFGYDRAECIEAFSAIALPQHGGETRILFIIASCATAFISTNPPPPVSDGCAISMARASIRRLKSCTP